MLTNDFVKIFQKFNVEEIEEFGNYLKCFHSTRGNELLIFDYLQEIHPNFSVSNLDEKEAFSKIFIGEDYNYQKLRKGLHFLKNYAKEFIAWQTVKKDEFQQNKALLDFYKENNLPEEFFKYSNKLLKSLEQTEVRNAQHFYEKFMLKNAQYFHPNFRKITKIPFQIEEVSENLDLFFALLKLEQGGEAKNREAIFKQQSEMLFLEEIIKNLQTDKLQNLPLLQIYELIMELHGSNDDEKFQMLKALIFRHYQLESPNKQFNLYRHLLNFASRKTKQGVTKYYKEAFEIYQFGLEEKLILSEGLITPTSFGNIIDTACKLKKTDWAKDFLLKWQNHLNPDFAENVVKLGKARIASEEDRHQDVLDYLVDCENFVHTLASIRARLLYARSFYLKNKNKIFTKRDKEIIRAFCTAFKNYVNRKGLKQQLKMSAVNFVKYYKRLTNISKSTNIEKILAEVDDCKYLFYKDWFQEEIKNKTS